MVAVVALSKVRFGMRNEDVRTVQKALASRRWSRSPNASPPTTIRITG